MARPLRVLIADDEAPARAFLGAMLETIDDVEIVAEAKSGREAVTAIEREKPDLVLLDLAMPDLDGLAVIRALKQRPLPLFAFVSGHDEYAVRAFEINALDYLLKPVERKRLLDTLSRAREWGSEADALAGQAATPSIGPANDQMAPAASRYLDRIPIRRRNEIVIVPVSQIASIVAERELLHVVTVSGEHHTLTYRLRDLEQRLDPARFVRLGRGTLANVDLIVRVEIQTGGTHVAVLNDGERLSVSRLQSRFLRHRFLSL